MSFIITQQGPETGQKENIQGKSVVTPTGTGKLSNLAKVAIKPFITF
jgi:hypothetical protein